LEKINHTAYSVFVDTRNFVTKGDDADMLMTKRIDTDHPMMICIRYKTNTRYIPMTDFGMAFEIKRLKLNKIEKKHITDSVSYYLVDAS